MVIPWIGFPLSALLKQVEPTGQAKYVEFATLIDPEQFPGQKPGLFGSAALDWPYIEGLRLDEAMHPLDPAHLRHVRPGAAQPERRAGARGHPVEVRLQERQVDRPHPARPTTSPRRPGTRPRPRSTASTRTSTRPSTIRAGARPPSGASASSAGARPCMFNGYADQVASLYAGMDLQEDLLSVSRRAARIARSRPPCGLAVPGAAGRFSACWCVERTTSRPTRSSFITRTLG